MAVKSRRQQQQQHRETRHDKPRRSGPEIEEKKSGVFDRGKSRLVSGQIGSRGGSLLNIGIPLLLAAVAGVLHWYHISSLFENDRHFSHLSTLEKEMGFRTEMGLYYSYFKTIIEAPSFLSGVIMVMNDNRTEYPLIINTLKRFNLYPEILLASWYRLYTGTMGHFDYVTKTCWTVNRGEGLHPVNSCEGLGDPASFYVAIVFALNGLMLSFFFIIGAYVSGSSLGGIVTVLCFFFNHGESTRVMWTPPLRESFSYPFLIFQMLVLTHILRTPKAGKCAFVALSVSNVFFMLPWQFAQFVLLTQVASLFAAYIIGYLESDRLQHLLYAHMASLLLCFVLMFGNSMLLTSFYASSLVSMGGIIALKSKLIQYYKEGFLLWIAQSIILLISTIILKMLLSILLRTSDDAHISNLIKSKFTSYKDFDTMMYTCAAEFDFMEKETPLRYTRTLLLPTTLFVIIAITVKIIKDVWIFSRKTESHMVNGDKYSLETTAQFSNGEMVYHFFQLIAFAVLAILIMRLKLFLTPHMCIMASLICSRQLFGWIKPKALHHLLVVGIISAMAVQGIANLRGQWNIIGEFSNVPQEELLEWIKTRTKADAVFAGAMPTMASVKLSTGRPIVNHPHYEDAGLRERTKLVYAMYSRKPAEVVKQNLMRLKVDYFILEESWCIRRTRPGCSMPEIWDVEDPSNIGKVPLCTLIEQNPQPHFKMVFQNDVYTVLRVPKATKDL
ncbi:dpy-19-like 1, like [Erpetoichthys calabaricus]|uniref:Dpy-19-like 1, like (H. sapiens) n=1 Tax=Erpetoichthys calabaricus TaxID=27687 RepID=A0A8C4TB11_ERPCA|nr:dpy-19-like 1, like [Erpetoichthys calabaricus]